MLLRRTAADLNSLAPACGFSSLRQWNGTWCETCRCRLIGAEIQENIHSAMRTTFFRRRFWALWKGAFARRKCRGTKIKIHHNSMISQKSPLKIIIVGAGLSGLSAAISCAQSGHPVTILEGSEKLTEVGAGLQITPNSSRLFKAWGLDSQLEELAAEPTSLTVHRYSDGMILAQQKCFHRQIRQRYGAPFLDLHRADLQLSLVRKAHELGVEVVLGAKVASVDFSQPSVTTERGATYSGDLVVAADGLWSKCRECFLGRRFDPVPTGDLAYRIILRRDEIDDPELREMVNKPAVHFWIGANSHVVAYSLKDGKEYNLVLLVPDDLPPSVSRQKGSVGEMRALFKGWDPILTRFLDCVKDVDKWKLMYLPELESWINEAGNFVMIGDACHPMLPYLAQGANSSMEDGAMLGVLLRNLGPGFGLKEALQTYQRLRKRRGEAIVKETFKQRESFHMVDGPEQEARDELFLKYLGREIDVEFPSRWTCPKVQPWLYGYDTNAEAEKALQEVKVV
ncbi:FAD/NAD(P)-binding domain-containing protein [Rhizodiscina lignyota]|uniref:FAD/NAD(P)-binding domain-containing protein n=1 Tax=Rhizodiscina lignyota TaxID=1504668 RepID=A0A9P4I4D0_9PEZI|nr:FAD/NAD(P)-binding domain-containing protein [Rhizodiscina lignyota]